LKRLIFVSLADFSAVQDLTDEITSTEKPSAAASWGKEGDDSLENGTLPAVKVGNEDPAVNGDLNVDKEAPLTPKPAPDVTPENHSEAPIKTGANDVSSSKPSDVKSAVRSAVPTTKASERCIDLCLFI